MTRPQQPSIHTPTPTKPTLPQLLAQACGDPGSITTRRVDRNRDTYIGEMREEPTSQWIARAVALTIQRYLTLLPCHTTLCSHGPDHHLRHTVICNYQRADMLDDLLEALDINIHHITRATHTDGCPACNTGTAHDDWSHYR